MIKLTLNKVIVLTALILASAAAYFSVFGIAALLAGGGIGIIVFASAIELGKLVSVSFLYRYFREMPKTLRAAFLFFSVGIMLITSIGIYGYLTAAYTKASVSVLTQQGTNTILASQDTLMGTNIQLKMDRIAQLGTIRTQQEARLDTTIAKTVYGTSRTITEVQRNLRINETEIQRLQTQVDSLLTARSELTTNKIKGEVALQTDSGLGPFIYIAAALGVPLDTAVKWFILMLVLVFDPLSVCLVIAYNFLHQRKEKTMNPLDELTQEAQKLGMYDIKEDSVHIDLPGGRPAQSVKGEINVLPIDVESQVSSASLEPESPLPYYMAPDFDWNDKSKWENDLEAVTYKSHFR